jgi:hypothetical protein
LSATCRVAAPRRGNPGGRRAPRRHRRSAHERFARAVDGVVHAEEVLRLAVVVAALVVGGAATRGGLGGWACPDGLEDPERTVRELDAWAVRQPRADRAARPLPGMP